MVQFGVKVAGLVAKVGRIIPRVIDALTELKRLLGRPGPSIGQALDNLTKLLRRGHVPQASGRGQVPLGPRIPTRAEFESFRDSLPSRGSMYGSPDARKFQQTHAGTIEYKIGTGDDKVWADGLIYDPTTGGVVVEAKFVDNPGGSAIHEGTAPPFLIKRQLASSATSYGVTRLPSLTRATHSLASTLSFPHLQREISCPRESKKCFGTSGVPSTGQLE